jgi:hypothetical protein
MRPSSVITVVVTILLAGTAGAQSLMTSEDHCTEGNAMAIARAFYPLWSFGSPQADETTLCQFRSFAKPLAEICFCEHDVFFGGNVWSVESTDPDEMRAGRDFLRRLDSTFSLSGPDGGRARLVSTALGGRSAELSDEGPIRTMWTQNGVLFSELAPGTYDFVLAFTHPDTGVLEFNENRFRVLSHDVAHALGRPLHNPFEGSVTCPQELDCDDGLDNDGDGAIDCAEVRCRMPWWESTDPLNQSCFSGDWVDLGSELGSPVFHGSTVGKSDDWALPCTFALGRAGDDELRWTAPLDGTYTFDTIGSDLDSVLGVSTDGMNLCNEDISDDVWQSSVTMSLQAGAQVRIIVDGWNDDEASYVLNITRL